MSVRLFERPRDYDESSRQYWEITLDGASITMRWGNAYSSGQIRTRSFSSEADAQTEHDRIVHANQSRGFIEVDRNAWQRPPEPRPASSVAGLDAPVLDLIERLDAWMRTHRPERLHAMNPPATATEIATLEARIGFPLPIGLKALLAWRNGDSLSAPGRFQLNWDLMSTAEIAEASACMNDMLGYDFDRENWWHDHWIPFLANGGGDHACIDLWGTRGGAAGQVINFWHDDPQRKILYPDLRSWLLVYVSTLEKGAWRENAEHGFFEVDEDTFNRAMGEICPGYPKE